MQQITSLEEVSIPNSWVTIGSFDGVHRGHQMLVQDLVREAHSAGCQAVVVTFFPHPSVVLRGASGPFYLTSPEERAKLLEELGVDQVLTLRFTRELADTPAEDFIALLQRQLGMRQLWVGFNFALGRGREGDIPLLQRLGDLHDFDLHIVQPIEIDGEIVSSSLIRSLLNRGEVARAADFLGRRYVVEGEIVHGDGRGRTIGIPTANFSVWPERVLPAGGVYAGWVHFPQGERRAAVANIGVRPTFENQPPVPRLEALVLDFDQDLYGQTLSFEFVQHLRGEQRFSSVEALIEQIQKDVQTSRGVLAHER